MGRRLLNAVRGEFEWHALQAVEIRAIGRLLILHDAGPVRRQPLQILRRSIRLVRAADVHHLVVVLLGGAGAG